MKRTPWGILLGGLLVLALGGLLLPVVTGTRVGSEHRQSAALDQPQVQAGATAPAAPDLAPSSSAPTTVRPVAPTSRPETAAPTLQILSPKSGEDAAVPVTVRYLISGIDLNTLSQLRIGLTIGSPAFYRISLPISGLQGSASMPDDKMISGHRDLVFSLERIDGAPVAGSPAAVVVSGVTISGRR